ncbi:hypothetical protein YTPLAS72_00580 [Nitrospira sp.]|nr:hypothetical protein YTPLAS72_00580 [Nitrospira sp.]
MNKTDSLENTTEQMGRKAEDAAQRAGEKARQVSDDISEMAQRGGEKARHLAERVGDEIADASGKIQDKLRETGKGVGEVVNTVSEKVRSSAQYLEDSSVEDVVEDVAVLVKRYPIHAVLLGVGIGFLLGRGRSR